MTDNDTSENDTNDNDTNEIANEINAIHETQREVGTGRIAEAECRTVVLRRRYTAPVEDVWDACTDPERISRWFLPITGELRLGGKYQLEGNAGGEILRCEPPRMLRATWVMGEGPPSEVEVRLTAAGDTGTVFELEHIAVVDPTLWQQYGPGAVGVGWDLSLLGLSLHLRGVHIADPDAWQQSAAAKDFMTRSSQAWAAAHEASGTPPTEAASAARETTAFYTGT